MGSTKLAEDENSAALVEDDKAARKARRKAEKKSKKERKRERREESTEDGDVRTKKKRRQKREQLETKEVQTTLASANVSNEETGNSILASNHLKEPPTHPISDTTSSSDSAAATATNTHINHDDLTALEQAYQTALQEFKADKTNKDKRRAKTAAKRAWDAALIQTAEPQGAQVLTCRHCSQLFLFAMQNEFEARNWDTPNQCKDCTYKIGLTRTHVRQRRDETPKNMCYEFQKTGTCSRGDRCKFSHWNNKGNNNTNTKPEKCCAVAICRSVTKGIACPHGDSCRFRHEERDQAGGD